MNWIDDFFDDLDEFDYEPEVLISLIETSTFDVEWRDHYMGMVYDIQTKDEFMYIYYNLKGNQLAPIDRPHGRLSAKERQDAIPT